MRVVRPGMVPDIPEYTGHLPPPSTHTARTHLSTVLLMPRLEARLWKMWLTLKQKQPPYTKNTVIWKIIVIKNGSHQKVLPLKSYFEIAIERHFFLTCGGNSHSFMIKWFVKGVWGTRIVSGCQWQTDFTWRTFSSVLIRGCFNVKEEDVTLWGLSETCSKHRAESGSLLL